MELKFLPISSYQLWKVEQAHGFGLFNTGGSLVKDNEMIAYWEEVDRDSERIYYDYFIREDFYPHEAINAEYARMYNMMKGRKDA